MTARVLQVGTVIALTNVAYFAFVVLAGRSLPEAEFGVLSLCISAAVVLNAVGDLGLTSTLARWFAGRSLAEWNWARAFVRVLPGAGALAALAVLVLALGYEMTWTLAATTSAAGVALVVLRSVGAGLLRAHARPVLGVLVEKGYRLVLPALAGILVLGAGAGAGEWVAGWSAVLVVLALAAAALLVRMPRGTVPLPPEYWSGALLFWIMSALYLVAAHLDRFFIPAALDMESLAGYSAVANLTMGFDVLGTALGYVLLPRFGRQGSVSLLRESVLPLSLAGLALLVYALLGAWLLSVLFADRYDAYAYLVLPLCAVGVVRTAYVVPSLVVATRFMRPGLLRLFGLNVFLLAGHLIALAVLLPVLGLVGAVVANLAVAVLRYAGATLLARRRLAELDRA